MENLETISLTILWNDILERVNKTSKVLQSEDMNILVSMNLLETLKTYLQEIRDKFSEYELKASSRCPYSDYSNMKNGNKSEVCVLLDMMDQKKRYFSVKVQSSR